MSTILHSIAVCSRCGCDAHDMLDDFTDKRGHRTWLLWCIYCGNRDRIDAPATPEAAPEPVPRPAEAAEEFRLKYGRFQGMTLAEADAQPNGRKYLEWMLANNKALAPRVASYLKASSA
jgi:hypothetical protein